MGHPNRNMKDSGAVTCMDLAQQVTEENLCVLPRDHPCDILVKSVPVFNPAQKFCLRPSFGLIPFAEENSKQPVDCVLWLLMSMLMQIYNGKGYQNEWS